MIDSGPLLLQVFIEMDEAALVAMRDGQFESTITGTGTLIRASVNGSSFEYHPPSTMTSSQVTTFAQLALNYKRARVSRPITRTTVRFS